MQWVSKGFRNSLKVQPESGNTDTGDKRCANAKESQGEGDGLRTLVRDLEVQLKTAHLGRKTPSGVTGVISSLEDIFGDAHVGDLCTMGLGFQQGAWGKRGCLITGFSSFWGKFDISNWKSWFSAQSCALVPHCGCLGDPDPGPGRQEAQSTGSLAGQVCTCSVAQNRSDPRRLLYACGHARARALTHGMSVSNIFTTLCRGKKIEVFETFNYPLTYLPARGAGVSHNPHLTQHAPTTGPLQGLSPLPGMLLPQISTWLILSHPSGYG